MSALQVNNAKIEDTDRSGVDKLWNEVEFPSKVVPSFYRHREGTDSKCRVDKYDLMKIDSGTSH